LSEARGKITCREKKKHRSCCVDTQQDVADKRPLPPVISITNGKGVGKEMPKPEGYGKKIWRVGRME